MRAEDLLDILARKLHEGDNLFSTVLADVWYHRFILNVWTYTQQRKPLSTEQARILLRIGGRVRDKLVKDGSVEAPIIDRLLRQPSYRLPLYQSSVMPREVRHLGGNLLGLRFKLGDTVRQVITTIGLTENGEPSVVPWFNQEFRLWVIPVTRITLPKIMNLIKEHRFGFDEAALEYITLCSNSTGHPTTVFLDAEGRRIIANVCDNDLAACWLEQVAGAANF